MIAENNINLKNQRNPLYWVIFFIVFFISDDTFTFGTNPNIIFILSKYIAYFFILILLFQKVKLKVFILPSKAVLTLYFIIFAVVTTIFLNFQISGGYIYQIWIALLAFLITQYIPQKDLVNTYLKFLYFISLVSIIVFIIAMFLPSLLTIFPISVNENDASFYNLGICLVFNDGEVRNTGIFREPGVFMIYLTIGVLFELFIKEKINNRYLFVFLTALFLTLSTAAYIILGLVCFAYLFRANSRSNFKNKLLIMGVAVVAIIVIALSPNIYSKLFDKIGKDSINEGSSLARGASVLVNLNIFVDNPVGGVGIKDFPSSFETYSLKLFSLALSSENNTNTITTIFAVYGIVLGIIFIFMVINLVNKFSKSIIISALLFLVFMMLFSNEDLRYSLMTFVLLFWGLKYEQVKDSLIKN
jgi:O-antigen ligase